MNIILYSKYHFNVPFFEVLIGTNDLVATTLDSTALEYFL